MKPLLSSIFTLLLISCGSSSLVKNLDGSDRVEVQFKFPGTDSVIKVVEATQSYAVEKLVRFADGKETKLFKCGYDGNILFYKNEVLAGEVGFNYNTEGCHHFLHLTNGKITATEMSNEAADFLRSLANQIQ